jgi:hypothetical protein
MVFWTVAKWVTAIGGVLPTQPRNRRGQALRSHTLGKMRSCATGERSNMAVPVVSTSHTVSPKQTFPFVMYIPHSQSKEYVSVLMYIPHSQSRENVSIHMYIPHSQSRENVSVRIYIPHSFMYSLVCNRCNYHTRSASVNCLLLFNYITHDLMKK